MLFLKLRCFPEGKATFSDASLIECFEHEWSELDEIIVNIGSMIE
ncbi:MAG: hypothetical protein ACI84C_001553 [Flavobacteriales bacterium]|jgi:hypothetical protein